MKHFKRRYRGGVWVFFPTPKAFLCAKFGGRKLATLAAAISEA